MNINSSMSNKSTLVDYLSSPFPTPQPSNKEVGQKRSTCTTIIFSSKYYNLIRQKHCFERVCTAQSSKKGLARRKLIIHSYWLSGFVLKQLRYTKRQWICPMVTTYIIHICYTASFNNTVSILQ